MRKKIIHAIVGCFFLLNFCPLMGHAIKFSSTVSYPVGELGKEWEFPSDHLPIGLTTGNIHIASWNILNTRYIHHILTNEQGLKESQIITTNIPIDENYSLTIRENTIINNILYLLYHPTHPRSIIALQETSSYFLKELQKKLPRYAHIVSPAPQGIAFIYNSNTFEKTSLRSSNYRVRPKYTYMTISLRERNTGIFYHFVQSHIPAPRALSTASRKEFADDIFENFDPDAITIIMGDMNRSPDFLMKDLTETAAVYSFPDQLFLNAWISYPTHINTYKEATWIDNLFYHNPFSNIEIHPSKDPDTFFLTLKPITEILKSLRPIQNEKTFDLWCQLKLWKKAVVYGSPPISMINQLESALNINSTKTFDLKARFLDDYYQIHQIKDPQEKKRIQEQYTADNTLQIQEYNWLKHHQETLFQELQTSTADLIIFDEFDLTEGLEEINPQKLATVLSIVQLAKKTCQKGKKILLILHNSSVNSNELWDEIQTQFLLSKDDLVSIH